MTPDQTAQVKQVLKHAKLLRVDLVAAHYTIDEGKADKMIHRLDALVLEAIEAIKKGRGRGSRIVR